MALGNESGEDQGYCTDGCVDLARDRRLVARCQAGDAAAFDELYRRYERRLLWFCQRRLHDLDLSRDAVQEAFTRAWRALPGFAGDRRFYPWLTVIAANICTDVIRHRARTVPVADVPSPLADRGTPDLDEQLLHAVDVSLAVRALGQLSERHRRVLLLREGSGWSAQRIAEHEGVAVPVLETLLWRARQALKREFAALSDSAGRMGAVVWLGMAAVRRAVGRAVTRAGGALPLQAAGTHGARSIATSLSIVAGVVAGAAFVVSSPGGPGHAARPSPHAAAPAAPGSAAPTHAAQSSGGVAMAGGPVAPSRLPTGNTAARGANAGAPVASSAASGTSPAVASATATTANQNSGSGPAPGSVGPTAVGGPAGGNQGVPPNAVGGRGGATPPNAVNGTGAPPTAGGGGGAGGSAGPTATSGTAPSSGGSSIGAGTGGPGTGSTSGGAGSGTSTGSTGAGSGTAAGGGTGAPPPTGAPTTAAAVSG